MSILCDLGIHDFSKWQKQDDSGVAVFIQVRECKRCGQFEARAVLVKISEGFQTIEHIEQKK